MRVLGPLLMLFGIAAALPAPADAQPPQFVQQWGSQGSAAGKFSFPFGIAWSPLGRLYVCDQFNFRVQYFTGTGDYLGSFAHPDPYRIAVGPDGTVYLSTSNKVRRVSANGAFLQEWGGERTPGGAWFGTVALAVESGGNVLVLHSATQHIYRFTSDGQYLGQIAGEMSPGEGAAIAVNQQDEVYVSGPFHGNAYTVVKFSTAGEELGTIIPPIATGHPTGLGVDGQGNLYFVDPAGNQVLKFSSSGQMLANWGTFGTAPGQFDRPVSVALDGNGRIFISDLGNHRIQVFGDETPATLSTWGRVKAAYRE